MKWKPIKIVFKFYEPVCLSLSLCTCQRSLSGAETWAEIEPVADAVTAAAAEPIRTSLHRLVLYCLVFSFFFPRLLHLSFLSSSVCCCCLPVRNWWSNWLHWISCLGTRADSATRPRCHQLHSPADDSSPEFWDHSNRRPRIHIHTCVYYFGVLKIVSNLNVQHMWHGLKNSTCSTFCWMGGNMKILYVYEKVEIKDWFLYLSLNNRVGIMIVFRICSD